MRGLVLVALVLSVLAGSAVAQEAPQAPGEERDSRPVIQVLQHPYDIASFYRSDEPRGYFSGAGERYPIASYYRGGTSPSGYSRFWTSGYVGVPRPLPGGATTRSYGSRIGENGDLFLFAPTFLAPVGPLTDVFFESR